MSATRVLLGLGALALGVTGPLPAASGVVVEGSERARILPPAGALIQNYENAGYKLRKVGDEILVTIEAGPLVGASRFTPPAAIPTDPIARLARTLTLDSETHYEATSRILGWVARSISYDLDRAQPQDARTVLARRTGFCTGVARLTVALLQAAGIRAREVAGYVLDAGEGSSSGFHRWIEAYVPDHGWVFSDPLRSHHFVPATYLRLASEELQSGQGLEGLLLERTSTITAVDLYLYGTPDVTARRQLGRQSAATLHVHVGSLVNGHAALTGQSLRRTRPLHDGKTTFVGLEPGSYTLRLTFPTGIIVERAVELRDRVRRTISLPAGSNTRSGIYKGAKE